MFNNNIQDALINLMLNENKKIKTEDASLINTYNKLDDEKEVPDVEGLVDDVLVITDPNITSDEYDEIIDRAQEIVEDTPEGEIPLDEEYIGQYAQTCPHCGSTFVAEQILEPGATCPICLEVPDAFVVVGKLEAEDQVAEANGIGEDEESEIEDEFGPTDLDIESDNEISDEEGIAGESENELERDIASKQIVQGNKLTEGDNKPMLGDNKNDEIELPSTTDGTARQEIEDMLDRSWKRHKEGLDEALNFKKYGITRAPEKDFADDGNHFKGYMCNGIPISYLRSNGEIYLYIDINHLGGLNYEEYSKLPSYKECDKYNGGLSESEIDLADVADICKRIKAEYDEAVANQKEVTDDEFKVVTDSLYEKAKKEFEDAKAAIRAIDATELLNFSEYALKDLKQYLRYVQSDMNSWNWEKQQTKSQTQRRDIMSNKSQEYYKKESYWLQQIKEIIAEQTKQKNESYSFLRESKQEDIRAIMAIVNEEPLEESKTLTEAISAFDLSDELISDGKTIFVRSNQIQADYATETNTFAIDRIIDDSNFEPENYSDEWDADSLEKAKEAYENGDVYTLTEAYGPDNLGTTLAVWYGYEDFDEDMEKYTDLEKVTINRSFNESKLLKKEGFEKAQATLPLDNFNSMGIIVSEDGSTVQYMYSYEDITYESDIEYDEEGNAFFRDEDGEIWMISDFMKTESKHIDQIEKLEETGEWDDNDPEMQAWKEELQIKAEELSDSVNGKVIMVKGFDKYQGPYAIINTPNYGDIAVWFDFSDETGTNLSVKIKDKKWISGNIEELTRILNNAEI